jgi:hypothetical protein
MKGWSTPPFNAESPDELWLDLVSIYIFQLILRIFLIRVYLQFLPQACSMELVLEGLGGGFGGGEGGSPLDVLMVAEWSTIAMAMQLAPIE